MKATLAALTVLVALAGTPEARAQRLGFTPTPADSGWQIMTLRGRDAAKFTTQADGSLKVTAEKAIAFLVRDVSDIAMNGAFRLSWSWKVSTTPPATDLSRKGGDDRALAVHVWFPKSEDGVKPRSTFGRFIARFTGRPTGSRWITYIWGGDHRAGASFANPYDRKDGRMIVLAPQTTELDSWQDIHVDLAADYERLFGEHPPPPSHIAIQSDSDDTKSHAEAWIRDLRFEALP